MQLSSICHVFNYWEFHLFIGEGYLSVQCYNKSYSCSEGVEGPFPLTISSFPWDSLMIYKHFVRWMNILIQITISKNFLPGKKKHDWVHRSVCLRDMSSELQCRHVNYSAKKMPWYPVYPKYFFSWMGHKLRSMERADINFEAHVPLLWQNGAPYFIHLCDSAYYVYLHLSLKDHEYLKSCYIIILSKRKHFLKRPFLAFPSCKQAQSKQQPNSHSR